MRDRSVGELLPEIGMESSNLSQQLGVLRRAGVVDARKDGNTVIYSIASPDIADLLAVARKVLTRMLSDRVAVLEDLRSGGGRRVAAWAGSAKSSASAGSSNPLTRRRRRRWNRLRE